MKFQDIFRKTRTTNVIAQDADSVRQSSGLEWRILRNPITKRVHSIEEYLHSYYYQGVYNAISSLREKILDGTLKTVEEVDAVAKIIQSENATMYYTVMKCEVAKSEEVTDE